MPMTLADWCRIQQHLKLYHNVHEDHLLIQTVDGIVLALRQEPNKLSSAIFGLAAYLLQQPRIENLLENKLNNEADRQTAEKKLSQWLDNNLMKFNPTGWSAYYALMDWAVCRCRWIINDIRNNHKTEGTGEISFAQRPPRGIDAPYNDQSDETLMDRLIQPELGIVSLSELDDLMQGMALPNLSAFFGQITAALASTPLGRLINYLETDPQGELQREYYQDDRCTYQYLAINYFLPELLNQPGKTLQEIIREFPMIDYNAIYRHLHDVFTPWITGIYLEILDDQEWQLMERLMGWHQERLTHTHRRNTPQCHVLYLAEQRLPCYQSTPKSWAEIADLLKERGWKGATPSYVEKFWKNVGRPECGALAARVLLYPETLPISL